jgi:hypothetical protein
MSLYSTICIKSIHVCQAWWLMPVISVIFEVEISKIVVWGKLWVRDPIQKITKAKKGLGCGSSRSAQVQRTWVQTSIQKKKRKKTPSKAEMWLLPGASKWNLNFLDNSGKSTLSKLAFLPNKATSQCWVPMAHACNLSYLLGRQTGRIAFRGQTEEIVPETPSLK